MFAVEDLSVMHAADLGVPVPSFVNGTLEEVKSQVSMYDVCITQLYVAILSQVLKGSDLKRKMFIH